MTLYKDAPIYNTVIKYIESKAARFHTPAHSGFNLDDLLYCAAPYDITELSFSDNLLNPEGVIKSSEEYLAEQYKAVKALFLTSGGTGGIFITLSAIRQYGNNVVCTINAHKAFYSAARILNLNVTALSFENILTYLRSGNKPAAVFITSPDYYGNLYDITMISEEAKSKNVKLILDNSHGAHYIYSPLLPKDYSTLADIAVMSLHKTLPVFTGGATILVNDKDMIDSLMYYRTTLHSTSPSYLTLASIDYMQAYMKRNGENLYKDLFKDIDALNFDGTPYSVIKSDDRTRLNINCGGKCAYTIKGELEKRGIYPEMCDSEKIVFIITPFNKDRLREVREAFNIVKTKKSAYNLSVPTLKSANTEGEIEFIDIKDCLGRVVMGEIGIYPPGTAILRSGDILSSDALNVLLDNRKHIIGLVNGRLPVLK